MTVLEGLGLALGVVTIIFAVLHLAAWRSLRHVAHEPYPIRDARSARDAPRDYTGQC
jgi:hypothetical protein